MGKPVGLPALQSFRGKYSFFTWKFAYRVAVLVGRATMGKTYLLGTSINDVRRFSAIFDLLTYHVQQCLPYNVLYSVAFFGPPYQP